MIGLGIVIETRDHLESGALRLNPLSPAGEATDDIIQCAPCSPNLGNGQGIFTCPGPGSFVLYVDIQEICQTMPGFKNLQYKYVWIGAVGTQQEQNTGRTNVRQL